MKTNVNKHMLCLTESLLENPFSKGEVEDNKSVRVEKEEEDDNDKEEKKEKTKKIKQHNDAHVRKM